MFLLSVGEEVLYMRRIVILTPHLSDSGQLATHIESLQLFETAAVTFFWHLKVLGPRKERDLLFHMGKNISYTEVHVGFFHVFKFPVTLACTVRNWKIRPLFFLQRPNILS